MIETKLTYDNVKEYYGKILASKNDLKTSCCCSTEAPPENIRDIIENIDNEILEKFYGCGSPIPQELEGCTVLDLGCGTGRDAYVMSALVGPRGKVIGIDMTDEQLEVARSHMHSQTRRFGLSEPNVEFVKGYIEKLKDAGIADNSVDVVVSNCVINLSPDKRAVFSEIFRVLKPGGELYFSDVFSSRRIPAHLASDPVIHGECLGGALYIEDFRRILNEVGCLDYRVASQRKFALDNPELEKKLDMIDFYSMTVRAFKLDSFEDICEDYGQAAIYMGSIQDSPHYFELDMQHKFHFGKPVLVCGNSASMLGETRFAKHFKIIGNRETHYGTFDCQTRCVQPVEPDKASCCGDGASC